MTWQDLAAPLVTSFLMMRTTLEPYKSGSESSMCSNSSTRLKLNEQDQEVPCPKILYNSAGVSKASKI